jgi:uncharacterized membrane protein YcaP (DUF421 family)
MWHDLWFIQISIVEKVVRTVLVYTLILLLFRFGGKRGLANLNTFDFIVIFLLSSVVQNAIIGPDNSVSGGVIGALTLVGLNAGINRWLVHDPRAERLFEGTATRVIENGRVDHGALRKLSIRTSELAHAVRLQNGDCIDDVAVASLEPDGQFLVSLKPDRQGASRGDVALLESRLDGIEALLRELVGQSAGQSAEQTAGQAVGRPTAG